MNVCQTEGAVTTPKLDILADNIAISQNIDQTDIILAEETTEDMKFH